MKLVKRFIGLHPYLVKEIWTYKNNRKDFKFGLELEVIKSINNHEKYHICAAFPTIAIKEVHAIYLIIV